MACLGRLFLSCTRELYWLLALLVIAFSETFHSPEYCSANSRRCENSLAELTADEIEKHIHDKCMLLSLPPVETETHSILSELHTVFKNDSSVLLGHLHTNATRVRWKSPPGNTAHPALAFYARVKRDRSCLLLPPAKDFRAEPYEGMPVLETLVQFLNEKCGTFRAPSGGLTEEGLMHRHIMHNLYSPSESVEQCVRLRKVPSKEDFFRDYAFRSRPVVIENAVDSWPAMKKWTSDYLRERYGQQTVHIKLTPDGIFEGVENANLWSGYSEDWIPAAVKSQLPYPDLVVVRPATAEMNFSVFLDHISSNNQTFSAYLEYSSIPYYMPGLQLDVFELPFVQGSLEVRHLNMWLSDGNTLGKLHFDPFDNILCQVRCHPTSVLPYCEKFLKVVKVLKILVFDTMRTCAHCKLRKNTFLYSVFLRNTKFRPFENFPLYNIYRYLIVVHGSLHVHSV